MRKMVFDHWRLIADGLSDGGFNMVTDRALLTACEEGDSPPTLRLYGWSRPTLTLGYSQDASREVDLERCREIDLPVIRRPTGGRALLHDRELTYSLVAPIPHPVFPSSLKGTFQVISEAILLSLQFLGVHDARINENNGRHVPSLSRKGIGRSPACFASLNHCEISITGKKLVGSAQRRGKRAFLQHGSILLDHDPELMNAVFHFDTLEQRRINFEQLARHVTSLSEICGRKVGFQEARQAFSAGFRKSIPGNWIEAALTPWEIETRDQLLISNPTRYYLP